MRWRRRTREFRPGTVTLEKWDDPVARVDRSGDRGLVKPGIPAALAGAAVTVVGGDDGSLIMDLSYVQPLA